MLSNSGIIFNLGVNFKEGESDMRKEINSKYVPNVMPRLFKIDNKYLW